MSPLLLVVMLECAESFVSAIACLNSYMIRHAAVQLVSSSHRLIVWLCFYQTFFEWEVFRFWYQLVKA